MAIPTFVWLGTTYKWAERGLVGLAFLSTAFLIDINFYSMEDYRGDSRGFEIGLTDWTMISLLIVMLTSNRWKNKKITLLPPNSGLLTIYLAIAVISVYIAYVQIYAGFGLLKILRGLIVFIVAYNYLQDEEDLRFIIGVLAIIVIIEFVMVIDQRLSGMYRAKGSTPHSNTLAGYINMINMLFFALLLGDKTRPTLYWIVLALALKSKCLYFDSLDGESWRSPDKKRSFQSSPFPRRATDKCCEQCPYRRSSRCVRYSVSH